MAVNSPKICDGAVIVVSEKESDSTNIQPKVESYQKNWEMVNDGTGFMLLAELTMRHSGQDTVFYEDTSAKKE